MRVSTTDADARVMKMGDGGFRPAFNVQLATTADPARVIVGVAVGNRGSDAGQSAPMLEQIEKRTGQRPSELLTHRGLDHFAVRGLGKALTSVSLFALTYDILRLIALGG